MKYLNLCFISLVFSFLIKLFNCFTFIVKDNYDKYCFKKFIEQDDQLTINFYVTSYPKEAIKVDLTYQKEKYSTKNVIYQVINEANGNYKSDKPLDEGYYNLCFYSKKGKSLYISLDFYTWFEDRNIKLLASDKQLKNINKDIKEMNNALEKMESNIRHIVHSTFNFFVMMQMSTNSVKRLTYLKICVVAVMSLFQIYIISKFFGPDKRVSSIKGVFKNKNDIL